MARLTHPELGTVIECDGAVEDHYRALGWSDLDAEVPDSPKRAPRKATASKTKG